MIPYMLVQALSVGEIKKIHLVVVSIISCIGLTLEHGEIRGAYAEYGA